MNREETLLLAIVIGTAGAMLLTSNQYAPDARIFPQAAAVVTILFGVVTVVQGRLGVGTTDGTDIVSRVQDSDVLSDELGDASEPGASDDGPGTQVGKAAEGEFRIDQPTQDYAVPFTDATVSLRVVVGVLLLVYLGAVWLLGIALASAAFLVLYARAVRLRWTVLAALAVFVALTLVLFGVWLETPLFRPAHELFSLPEVL